MTTSRKRPVKSDKINLTSEPMNWEFRLGLAMILAMVISGLALGIGAAGIYAATTPPFAKGGVKKLPKLKKVVIPKATPKTSVQKQLDAIKVSLPTLGVSASPMPDLKLAPLNLAIPKVPAKNVMKSFSVDKNIGYTGTVDLPMPDVGAIVEDKMGGSTGAPAGTPTTGQPATTPTSTAPTGGTGGSGTNSSTPTAANCAQFSGVPACSYVGDTNGQALCNSCRAAGM
jgi:hypothetical protein